MGYPNGEDLTSIAGETLVSLRSELHPVTTGPNTQTWNSLLGSFTGVGVQHHVPWTGLLTGHTIPGTSDRRATGVSVASQTDRLDGEGHVTDGWEGQ